MSAAVVYAEWWWTCDECGDCTLEPYDTRDEAERDANSHECEDTETEKRNDRR